MSEHYGSLEVLGQQIADRSIGTYYMVLVTNYSTNYCTNNSTNYSNNYWVCEYWVVSSEFAKFLFWQVSHHPELALSYVWVKLALLAQS